MTRIVIKEIIWDRWNTKHIEKHGVTKPEVELAINSFITHKRTYGGRYAIFGRARLRIITIVVEKKKTNVYYIVTARDAAKKERRYVYAKEKTKIT